MAASEARPSDVECQDDVKVVVPIASSTLLVKVISAFLLSASVVLLAGSYVSIDGHTAPRALAADHSVPPVALAAGLMHSFEASLEGHIRSVDHSWNGDDNGWSFADEDIYYYTQPPGMFPKELPSYSVTVKRVEDIQKAVEFAAKNNLTVSVKANGHSYMGAALGGQLLIYMGWMDKVNIQRNRTYCGVAHDSNEVGGGTTFGTAYRVILDNFTTVGGQGPTVNMGGGWMLGNGMSNEVLPMYGLGVDNILQHDIVLANGSFVIANECTNPDLFKALRGGGSGFGVVTSVHYKLHPPTPLQRYKWTELYAGSSSLSNPDVPKRWDLFFRWLDRWDKRWSTKYISGAAIYTFMGTHEEAIATPFYKDATGVFGEPVHNSYRSLIHFKLTDGASGDDYDNSINKSSMRQLGSSFVGNWLIPQTYLVDHPIEARNIFMEASASGALCPYHGEYFLGGLNNEITASKDPTSVHPATRKAAWQAAICDKVFMQKMMDMFPDSCVGINHAPAYLKDWQKKLWGPKYTGILTVKNDVDPENMFRGQQLVGSESYNLV